MPIFLTWLMNAAASLFAYLAAKVGAKVAMAATITTTFIAIAVASQVALYAAFQLLVYSSPSWLTKVLQFVAYMLPSNFSTCTGIIIAALIGKKFFELQSKWLELMASIR